MTWRPRYAQVARDKRFKAAAIWQQYSDPAPLFNAERRKPPKPNEVAP
jgi:hypothetical protein